MNPTPESRRSFLALGILGGSALFAQQALAAGVCADGNAGSALLDRYIAAVNARDTAAFAGFIAEAYIQNSGRGANGLAALVETYRGVYARMPDVQMRSEDRIIAGDRVVSRMILAATHTQPLQGIAPTGRRFELRTIDIWRIENGKFAEHWDIVDFPGLVKQLRGECIGVSMEGEMLKGHLDMIVLAALAAGPAHGYAVIEEIRRRSGEAFELPEGTVYPVLHRLEAAELLSSKWQTAESGRRRRVYALTRQGSRALAGQRAVWQKFSVAVGGILGSAR